MYHLIHIVLSSLCTILICLFSGWRIYSITRWSWHNGGINWNHDMVRYCNAQQSFWMGYTLLQPRNKLDLHDRPMAILNTLGYYDHFIKWVNIISLVLHCRLIIHNCSWKEVLKMDSLKLIHQKIFLLSKMILSLWLRQW